jgi:hypothetical protein
MPQYDVSGSPPIWLSSIGVINAAIPPRQPYIQYAFVMAAGSSGNLTFNDAASLADCTVDNQLISLPFSELSGGDMLTLFRLCTNGLVLSELPTGGHVSVLWYSCNPPGPFDYSQPLLGA